MSHFSKDNDPKSSVPEETDLYKGCFNGYERIKDGASLDILKEEFSTYLYLLRDGPHGMRYGEMLESQIPELISSQLQGALGQNYRVKADYSFRDPLGAWAEMMDLGASTVLRAIADHPQDLPVREGAATIGRLLGEQYPVSSEALLNFLREAASGDLLERSGENRKNVETLALRAAEEIAFRFDTQERCGLNEISFLLGNDNLPRRYFLPCRYVNSDQSDECTSLCRELGRKLQSDDSKRMMDNFWDRRKSNLEGPLNLEVLRSNLRNIQSEDETLKTNAIKGVLAAAQFASDRFNGEVMILSPHGGMRIAGLIPISVSVTRAKALGSTLIDGIDGIDPSVDPTLFGIASVVKETPKDDFLRYLASVEEDQVIKVSEGFREGLVITERCKDGTSEKWLEEIVKISLSSKKGGLIARAALKHAPHLSVVDELEEALKRVDTQNRDAIIDSLHATKSLKALNVLCDAELAVCRDPILGEEYRQDSFLRAISSLASEHLDNLDSETQEKIIEISQKIPSSVSEHTRSDILKIAALIGGSRMRERVWEHIKSLAGEKDLEARDRLLLNLLPNLDDTDTSSLIDAAKAQTTPASLFALTIAAFHKDIGTEARSKLYEALASDDMRFKLDGLWSKWIHKHEEESRGIASFAVTTNNVSYLSIVIAFREGTTHIFQSEHDVQRRKEIARRYVQVIDQDRDPLGFQVLTSFIVDSIRDKK